MSKAKSLILLLALISCVSIVKCYQALTAPHSHPDHPEKCWWNETSTAYSPGDVFSMPDSCNQVLCRNNFSFVISGCGVKEINDPKCKKIDHDLSLPYPDCCVDYECIDEDGNVTRI